MNFRKLKKFWTKQCARENARLDSNPFDAAAIARYRYAIKNIVNLKIQKTLIKNAKRTLRSRV